MNPKTYAYVIHPTRIEMVSSGGAPEEAEIISQHADYLAGLAEQKVVLFVGRSLNTDESTFGLIVFHADSDGEAQRIIDNDPAVQQGVMKAALFPFRLVHMSPAQSQWMDVSSTQ